MSFRRTWIAVSLAVLAVSLGCGSSAPPGSRPCIYDSDCSGGHCEGVTEFTQGYCVRNPPRDYSCFQPCPSTMYCDRTAGSCRHYYSVAFAQPHDGDQVGVGVEVHAVTTQIHGGAPALDSLRLGIWDGGSRDDAGYVQRSYQVLYPDGGQTDGGTREYVGAFAPTASGTYELSVWLPDDGPSMDAWIHVTAAVP